MCRTLLARVGAAIVLFAGLAGATLIPGVSFETLTDSSEIVVSGRIARSWAAWDPAHKYIWTHYELITTAALKGGAFSKVEFAEPGGELDGKIMSIAETVTYAPGENVVVFLSRMPNGYLRTTGWAQGKYSVDATGKLHAAAYGDGIMPQIGHAHGTPLATLEGISISELRQRVGARIRTAGGRAQ